MQDKVTKQEWKNTMTASVKAKIDWRMDDLGESYEQAKAHVKHSSIAGKAIWAELDAFFHDNTGQAWEAYLKANKEAQERISA